MDISKSSCGKLLEDSGKEYQRIADAVNALLRGEVSGKEVNQISDECLNNVDSLINEYHVRIATATGKCKNKERGSKK